MIALQAGSPAHDGQPMTPTGPSPAAAAPMAPPLPHKLQAPPGFGAHPANSYSVNGAAPPPRQPAQPPIKQQQQQPAAKPPLAPTPALVPQPAAAAPPPAPATHLNPTAPPFRAATPTQQQGPSSLEQIEGSMLAKADANGTCCCGLGSRPPVQSLLPLLPSLPSHWWELSSGMPVPVQAAHEWGHAVCIVCGMQWRRGHAGAFMGRMAAGGSAPSGPAECWCLAQADTAPRAGISGARVCVCVCRAPPCTQVPGTALLCCGGRMSVVTLLMLVVVLLPPPPGIRDAHSKLLANLKQRQALDKQQDALDRERDAINMVLCSEVGGMARPTPAACWACGRRGGGGQHGTRGRPAQQRGGQPLCCHGSVQGCAKARVVWCVRGRAAPDALLAREHPHAGTHAGEHAVLPLAPRQLACRTT